MNKRGFTLVEVLIAGTFLLLSLTSFNFLFRAAARELERADRLTRTVLSLESSLEAGSGEVRSLGPDLEGVKVTIDGYSLETMRAKL